MEEVNKNMKISIVLTAIASLIGLSLTFLIGPLYLVNYTTMIIFIYTLSIVMYFISIVTAIMSKKGLFMISFLVINTICIMLVGVFLILHIPFAP